MNGLRFFIKFESTKMTNCQSRVRSNYLYFSLLLFSYNDIFKKATPVLLMWQGRNLIAIQWFRFLINYLLVLTVFKIRCVVYSLYRNVPRYQTQDKSHTPQEK